MKRPAFQVYPADWRKDPELQSCSIVARGVWWELCCLMHECRPYGHLTRNGAPIPDANAATLIHVALPVYRKAIAELEAVGVPSRTAEGVLYSRRMVRDEHVREVRAAAGKQGGNPILLKQEDKQKLPIAPDLLNLPAKSRPPPSSSASSSSSLTPGVEVDRNVSTGGGAVHPKEEKNGSPKRTAEGPPWYASEAGVAATAVTFDTPRRPNEPFEDWRDRVSQAVQSKQRLDAADARKRSSH